MLEHFYVRQRYYSDTITCGNGNSKYSRINEFGIFLMELNQYYLLLYILLLLYYYYVLFKLLKLNEKI